MQRLKKAVGNEIEPTHPLLLELNEKLQRRLTDEEEAKMEEMSQQFKNEYLNHPKNTEYRRQKYEKSSKEAEILETRIKEAFIKYQSIEEDKWKWFYLALEIVWYDMNWLSGKKWLFIEKSRKWKNKARSLGSNGQM